MEGRQPASGILPSVNYLFEKGFTVQFGGDNSPSNSRGSPGVHAPTPIRPTTTVAPTNVASQQTEQALFANNSQPQPARSPAMGEPVKRKRGRPRKYAPSDNNMPLGSTPQYIAAPAVQSPAPKKSKEGQQPSVTKKQLLPEAGPTGADFTPHVITVAAGEDVAMKVMSFSQKGPRALCVLSANGAISNVTLRQPATSGGMVTYEGRFEILSLSGSFLPTENAGIISRTGGLSVSLAGPDGRVLGGGVAGLLMAASPVQVIVGSFVSGPSNQSKAGERGFDRMSQDVNINSSIPALQLMQEVSKFDQSNTAYNNTHQTHSSMMTSFSWTESDNLLDTRNIDTNKSLPGG